MSTLHYVDRIPLLENNSLTPARPSCIFHSLFVTLTELVYNDTDWSDPSPASELSASRREGSRSADGRARHTPLWNLP